MEGHFERLALAHDEDELDWGTGGLEMDDAGENEQCTAEGGRAAAAPASVPDDDAAEEAASDSSPDDMTCAICLERTPIIDIALVKGCEHQYCATCILHWATCKEWCPQCKKPFDYLLTHRQLDGSLSDYLVEESVVLLKRARWFTDHLKAREAGGLPMSAFDSALSSAFDDASAASAAAADASDWADLYEDYVDAALEEDEEMEQYYFSSAAGRARVTLGNRRWGEGGYMRAGRLYARPVAPLNATPNASGGSSSKGKAAVAAAAGKAAGGKGSTSKAAAAASSSSSGAGCSSSKAAAAAGGAGSSKAAAAGAARGGGTSGAGSSSSVAVAAGRTSASAAVVAQWLVDDDDDDYGDDDDFGASGSLGRHRAGGGGSSSSAGARCRSGGSSSRSRSRGVPAGPKLPKGSPACGLAGGPLVAPLGKSPGSGGFTVGSWGAAGGGSFMAAAGAAAGSCGSGSTPGSGRRAKRNARRAQADAGCSGLDFDD